MGYKLNVTEHAEELLDHLVYHLIYRLKNKEVSRHLLDSIYCKCSWHFSSVGELSEQIIVNDWKR